MNLFSWLAKAMGDGENPSTMRLIAVSCVPFIVVAPVAVWAWLSLSEHKLQDFPASVTGYVPIIVGTILGALHLNKREESKASDVK